MPRTVGPDTKSIAQAASVTAGRLSSGFRILPEFLIVGGQRCGTTSMYRTLAQHPLILKPIWHKGVHYFDLHYDRGLGWYRAHFPLRASAGRLERALGRPPLAFESSPYYMHHPLAPGRIARDLPGVKLVALVRDPVKRAHSAHTHELARGFDDEPFERALALEPQRLEGEDEREPGPIRRTDSRTLQHQAYVTRGQYADQLERLAALVGRERLLVLDSGGVSSPNRRRCTTECSRFSGFRIAAPRSSSATTHGRARTSPRQPGTVCQLTSNRTTPGSSTG